MQKNLIQIYLLPFENFKEGLVVLNTCAKCGRRGIFLRLNKYGWCSNCEETLLHTCIKCGRYAKDLQLNEEWLCSNCEKSEAAEARQRILQDKRAQFANMLNGIKCIPITISSEKIKVRPVSDLELLFSPVTKSSNLSKLSNFVVLDTETTGLAPSRDKVLEIAAIRFEDFTPVDKFTTLINPSIQIPAEVIKINGITDDMVKDAPPLYSVIPVLQKFINGHNIVGHNILFDAKFLYRSGLDFDKCAKIYDTVEIAKHVLKKPKRRWDKEFEEYYIDYDSDYDVEDYKLETLCDYYNIIFHAHRAAADCLATGMVYHNLVMDKLEK